MTAEERLQRARRIAEFLENDDMKQVFSELRDELFLDWQQARTEPERESLHAVSRALDRIAGKLIAWRDEVAFIKRAA